MATYEELLEAIRTVNKYHDLGDQIYEVRDNVFDGYPEYIGNPWDHPTVIAYSDAVQIINYALRKGPKP